jgi:hypothetical protein
MRLKLRLALMPNGAMQALERLSDRPGASHRPAGGIRQAVAGGGYGTMMALRGTRIIRVTLIEGTGELKLVTPD